jgi:hypothetical protein
MKHLDSNNILYDLQHGFRKARSCESQFLPFIQKLNATKYLSPFLKAGATFACFQSLSMVPVSIDFVYILVKIGAT